MVSERNVVRLSGSMGGVCASILVYMEDTDFQARVILFRVVCAWSEASGQLGVHGGSEFLAYTVNVC